jgi:hypothetical protein
MDNSMFLAQDYGEFQSHTSINLENVNDSNTNFII